jgi:uncharacterized protein YjcR
MSREKHTILNDEQRAAVARGWASSGMHQVSYAQFHGIKPRTLREWIQRWAPTASADVRALTIIEKAIRDLQALRDAVAVDVARHSAERHQEPEHEETRHPPSADPARPPAALVNAATIMAAPPTRKRGFEW